MRRGVGEREDRRGEEEESEERDGDRCVVEERGRSNSLT